MNILFSINHGFVNHMRDCIKSIIRFKSSDGYDFYVMHSDLTNDDIEMLHDMEEKNIRFHLVYVSADKIKDFPQTGRYPAEIYYRIYASALLPDDLDRILYLDADIIVVNPLDELYNMSFDGNYILACTHVRSFLTSVNLRRLGIEEKCPYVNSGVMLMNLDTLRNVQDFHEVEQFVELHKNDLTLPDQDIITALYGQHVGIIDSLKYNLSDRVLAFYNSTPGNYKIDLDWIQNNTVIIHYCGRQKPWNKNYVGVLDRFYKQIVR